MAGISGDRRRRRAQDPGGADERPGNRVMVRLPCPQHLRVHPEPRHRSPVTLARPFKASPDRSVASRYGVACEHGTMGSLTFSATLQPRGPAAAVVLDDAQVQAIGEGAKRFPVVATVNGYTW